MVGNLLLMGCISGMLPLDEHTVLCAHTYHKDCDRGGLLKKEKTCEQFIWYCNDRTVPGGPTLRSDIDTIENPEQLTLPEKFTCNADHSLLCIDPGYDKPSVICKSTGGVSWTLPIERDELRNPKKNIKVFDAQNRLHILCGGTLTTWQEQPFEKMPLPQLIILGLLHKHILHKDFRASSIKKLQFAANCIINTTSFKSLHPAMQKRYLQLIQTFLQKQWRMESISGSFATQQDGQLAKFIIKGASAKDMVAYLADTK